VTGGDRRGAGVEQDEAAGAVGVLAWPNSAACWSPAIPAIGTPAGSQPTSLVSAQGPEESTTAGSISRGMPSTPSISASQSTVFRSRHSVREALVTSVACTRPPVSFQSSHASTVPNASAPCPARGRAPATWSSSQPILVPEK
jgi:hypothetical protein